MSDKEKTVDNVEEEIAPLYIDNFIGDTRYDCHLVDINKLPNVFALKEDERGIPYVDCIGKNEAYQAEVDANGKNSDINYLLERFVGGDPAIVSAVSAGLDYASGNVDDTYADSMAMLEKFMDTRDSLKNNPLLNEFMANNDASIFEDKKKFFKKWDEFISNKKVEAEKAEKTEVVNNEQK